MTFTNTINNLIEQPVNYTESYLKRDLDKVEDLPVLEEMALQPKPNDKQ
jgi:hypothetical protein